MRISAAWIFLVGWWNKTWQRPHQITRQGKHPVVDAWDDFIGLRVGIADHFEFRIEVIDVMERKGFRSPWEHRRAEFELAVVATDQMEEVEAGDLSGGFERFP